LLALAERRVSSSSFCHYLFGDVAVAAALLSVKVVTLMLLEICFSLVFHYHQLPFRLEIRYLFPLALQLPNNATSNLLQPAMIDNNKTINNNNLEDDNSRSEQIR
jgi:hypothetical protein